MTCGKKSNLQISPYLPEITSYSLAARLQDSRVVMHFDFDYFFAQIEERENPEIKSQPVVVCVYSGRGEDKGAVSTANYLAREYGVKSGIPIAFAKKRLRNVNAVFLPVNHTLYNEVSRKLMSIIRSFGDKFEQVGVDEAYLEVTKQVNGEFEKAKQLATEIKREIFAKQKITCSIGVGPNKLVAKIAAGKQKPNGLTVVKPGEVQRFLHPLSIRELVGVGRKTEKILQDHGVNTVGELAAYDVNTLVKVFGKTLGSYFHNAALGIDESPVEQRGRAESVSRMATLKEDSRSQDVILVEIIKLAKHVHSSVVEQRLSFKTVTVIAVMNNLAVRSRLKTFEKPTKSLKAVEEICEALLKHLLEEITEGSVRRVGVKISGFTDEKGQRKLVEYLGNSPTNQKA